MNSWQRHLDVLIVLGAPNDKEGNLSGIAKGRLDLATTEYRRAPRAVLLTGGFGEHFNESPTPHAELARRYLMAQGVPDHAFLDLAFSSNTVEDAAMARSVLGTLSVGSVTVVTSTFHLERARLVFDRALRGYNVRYLGAEHDCSEDELERRLAHETRALAQLRANVDDEG